uniref:Sterile alpha motif domain containing 7 n=1 Tax=Gasterosteus aculeatus TaxID=69293 RepID=G3PXU9_GASAC
FFSRRAEAEVRMEMNAILHQKELENAHQKGLMGMDNPMAYSSNPMAFRGRQRMPDGHDVFVHRPTMDELHSNSILMSASPYPPISTLHRERGRRAGRRPNVSKSTESHVSHLKGQTEDKGVEQSPGAASGEEKEAEAKGDMGEECPVGKPHHQAKMDAELSAGSRKNYKEGEAGLRKACANSQDGSEAANSEYQQRCVSFLSGPPTLFLNNDEASEDIRKWTVNDVYNFINSVPTCSEYAQMFKDHMIDGETLPLLSEEHLLDTLGLKLGPALKIRSQVSRRLGNMVYMMNLPLSTSTLQPTAEKPADRSSEIGSPVNCNSEEMMASPRDPDILKSTEHLHDTENNSPPSASSETA